MRGQIDQKESCDDGGEKLFNAKKQKAKVSLLLPLKTLVYLLPFLTFDIIVNFGSNKREV